MDFTILSQLGVAVLLGGLIGLERERKEQNSNKSFAGMRTYTLISLLGATAYLILETMGVVGGNLSGSTIGVAQTTAIGLFLLITGGFLALVVAGYRVSSRMVGDIGTTSEIAAILVYLVGVLVGMGQQNLAVILTLAMLLILGFKETLHKFAHSLQEKEITSAIQFIIIAFVVLPLLPNEAYGPYDFFNPYVIWLMVVFISGISFLSYIAIKIFGSKKGICVTGFLAGLISSTALAFSFSEQSKKDKKTVNPYVLGLLIASLGMLVRVLVEVFVVNRGIFWLVAWPILAMIAVGVLVTLWLFFKKDPKTQETSDEVSEQMGNLKSPFSLWPALKFGGFFALILFVSKFASEFFGDSGVYAASFLSGILDVDAITVSMSKLAAEGALTEMVATTAIIIATLTNTMVKGFIFLALGARKVAVRLLAIFGILVIVGLGVLFFV